MDLNQIFNYKIILLSLVALDVLYLVYNTTFIDDKDGIIEDVAPKFHDNKRYIIDTPGCRIENLNPNSEEIEEYVYKVKKISCSSKGQLTYATREGKVVTLNINKTLLSDYSAFAISCCYSVIKRNPVGPSPDDNISFSDCTAFNDSVIVTENFIKVQCSNFLHTVYENVHSTLQPPKQDVSNKNNPNVILIGIDGVSRSNFIRSMPRTFEYCESNGWVNLKGYNKVADNTYPNFMAVLAGKNYSQAVETCDPYNGTALNGCKDYIWNKFKMYNYSTAYAEDAPRIATFNGNKAGFTDPPTDYYFRPYFLAADDLTPKYLCLKAHCTGPEKTGIRMQNLAKDFITTIRHSTPGFGMFWMNSFSHEDVNCPSSMDDDFTEFFMEMDKGGYLDNTFVIFFSDHGFRFGKIRQTHTGWMEERLPFIYIWVPYRFRVEFVEEYTNLLKNSEKLTTPFDVYMTLQHILSLYNKNFVESPSESCPKCHSLFKPISANKNCITSGIPQTYCTCSRYEKLSAGIVTVQKVANFFINKINSIIQSYGTISKGCSTYFLNRISHAKSLVITPGVEENIMVSIVTNPEAIFEATVKVIYNSYDTENNYTLMEINRLDRYAPKTFCVRNTPAEIYCYCKSVVKRFTNVFCNNKFCFM